MGRWIAEMTRHEQHPLAKEYWAWKRDRIKTRRVSGETTSIATTEGDDIHKYLPLREKQSLRLFRIFDVDLEAHEIFGCFYEESLVHNINSWFEAKGRLYEALSYTWSQPVEGILDDETTEQPWTVVICRRVPRKDQPDHKTFEGSKVKLQPNLAAYLKAVINAHLTKGVPLAFEIWIDALCIDQSNDTERQNQIELMGDIYRAATKVHIWLGENTKDWALFRWFHEVLLRAILDFVDKTGEEPWDMMAEYDPTKDAFWLEHLPGLRPPAGASWDECWESYWRFLFERRWFRRAWTYQEAMLARQAVVECGPDLDQLSFRSITDMASILHRTRWRPLLNMRFPHPSVRINPNKSILNLNVQSREIDKYVKRNPRYASDETAQMSEEQWLEAWRDWCGVVRLRECALLGDKIRATIGIANITRPPSIADDFFQATTNLDPDGLFRWMSAVFLNRSKKLDHLSEVGPHSRLQCPTWVADCAVPIWFLPLSHVKRFNAFPGENLLVGEELVVDMVLRAVGLRVGTVVSVGGTGNQTLPEWCLEHLFHLPEEYDMGENKNPQSSVEAMWRALIWDSTDSGEKPDESWALQFKEWIESHYIIRRIFPGYRSSLFGEDTLAEAWWDRAEQQLQHAEKVGQTHRHPAGPSLEFIKSAANTIQQHANWPEVKDLRTLVNGHAHPWDQVFARTSEMIPDFATAYKKAYWSAFAQRASQTLQGRTIITTTSGHLGIAHLHCAVNNEIWVLSGGRVAYALERFDPNEGRAEDKDAIPCEMHLFRGDCYIHGIMQGEFAIKKITSGGPKDLELLYIV